MSERLLILVAVAGLCCTPALFGDIPPPPPHDHVVRPQQVLAKQRTVIAGACLALAAVSLPFLLRRRIWSWGIAALVLVPALSLLAYGMWPLPPLSPVPRYRGGGRPPPDPVEELRPPAQAPAN